VINSLAKTYIKGLRDDGIVLTDDDIIALNDLACALSREACANSLIIAPRVGWAGDIPIHEPTQQSEYWCAFFASKWFECEVGLIERVACWLFRRKMPAMAYARAFALANARTVGFFDTLTTRKSAVKAVTEWVITVTCSDRELMAACLYAETGESFETVRHPDVEKIRQDALKDAPRHCPYTRIIEDAIEAGVGVSVAELKAMSAGELFRIARKHAEFQVATRGIGGAKNIDSIKKAVHDARFNEFIQLVAAIRQRGKAE
jgi:hypothetical protein